MTDVSFTKMQGCANDYVVVERDELQGIDLAQWVQSVTDRRLGVGADGVLQISDTVNAAFEMRMWNPDGSEAEMCGNGLRCAVRYACERRGAPLTGVAQTGAGRLAYDMTAGPDAIRIALGKPTGSFATPVTLSLPAVSLPAVARSTLSSSQADETVVLHVGSLGNPHAVCFVEDLAAFDVAMIGARIERHPHFPNRTNVEFVQVDSRTSLQQRTWERGAGETLACGTGAGAVCVAAAASNRAAREVEIHLRGGTLRAVWSDDDMVSLLGPAVTVFDGRWPTS